MTNSYSEIKDNYGQDCVLEWMFSERWTWVAIADGVEDDENVKELAFDYDNSSGDENYV